MKPRRTARCRAFTLIELLIVIAVIAILASMALPGMISSRKAANETSAIASLKHIANAQETYRARHAPPLYAGLDELGKIDLLDPLLIKGYKGGYTFTISTDGTTYTALATPSSNAGDRHFFLDETGVIRAATSAAADADSPPIQ